ncbi:FAD-binding protein [Allostreptomyces psammosilenae]|uniref:FAD-binding PCMH-type domain-containing protein n=1 Tax=Allostreptomyces psammosilenae TaxID=1892865 RepID=A0A852ZRX8_9ACTN|nr:FAD-binding protein [Allostreptomyces psammosilenae]NYI04565.1 hypothetical protein [Allostreptomyces psammosilenae]
MTALGVLGLDDGLVARAVHPRGRWIDGWNLHPTHHHVRAVADLDGDGRSEAVITSDWGVGILQHDGRAFRCPFGAARDTVFGEWRYDATTRPGRDRVMAAANLTGSANPELLVWSGTGMAALSRTETGLTSSRLHPNGTRLGGWVLSTEDNHFWGTGRFGTDARQAMVLTSPWGLGVISLARGTHLVMVPTGTRLGGWTLRTDTDQVRLIADLDGDGRDELLVTGRTGIAVLKPQDGGLVPLAVHRTGENLSGYLVGPGTFPGADLLRPGGAEEIVVNDHRGLHVLGLAGNRLERRAFAANGSRIDGWLVDPAVNHLLPAGDLTGDGGADFVVRSPWGIGVLGLDADHRFRCRALHPYGAALGDWRLASGDVIAGAGSFTRRDRRELLVVKPWDAPEDTPRFVRTEFVNWHRNIRRSLPTARPTDLAQLVSAVRRAGPRVGVAGSGWSFTDCAVDAGTRSLIDTSGLGEVLQGVLPDALDDQPGRRDRHLVHVEAGIKVHELNRRLDRLGLALPTLGGSRGQSLAGVLSTGVHGSDVSLPPIADAVRAIHLVGAGGRQWWIEPATAPLTTREGIDRAKARGALDPSLRQVWDDQWFNAALVAMGCAGVIYSVVLQCRPAFRLRSTTTAEPWSRAQRRVADLSLPDRRPRYLEINVNPADHSCRVVVREETTEPVRLPAASAAPSVGAVAAAVGLVGPGALGVLPAAIGAYVARTTAEIGALLAVPVAGPVLAAQRTEQALRPVEDAHRLLLELNLAAVDPHDPRRVADVLPTAINLLWAIGAFVVPGRALVDRLQSTLTAQQRPEGTTVGPSFRVMTGQPDSAEDGSQNHDETERLVESHEYAVPASRAVAFVDRLLSVIGGLRAGPDALIANLNLRFTARSRATLAMQRFDRTCHVEIYTFRGLRGNDAFRARLGEVVREFAAVPHWGQFHSPTEATPWARDGALDRWRTVMRALSEGDESFWSDFARARGLLPGE